MAQTKPLKSLPPDLEVFQSTDFVPSTNGGTGFGSWVNGQIPIGDSTSGNLDQGFLTAGIGINITNAPGSITLAENIAVFTSSGMWSPPTGTTRAFLTGCAGGGGGGTGDAVNFIQAAKNSAATVTTLTLTFGTSPTNGNTILMAINNSGGLGVTTSVSQTGVTWVKDNSATSSFNWTFELWRGTVGAGAVTTVTLTLSTASNPCAVAEEWSGLITSPLDQDVITSSGPSSSTTAVTGTTGTTTQAVELWWGALEVYAAGGGGTSLSGLTGGFTINTTEIDAGLTGTASLNTFYLLVSAVGTAGTQGTMNGAPNYYTQSVMATYKAKELAGAGGGGGGASCIRYPVNVMTSPIGGFTITIGAGGSGGVNGGNTSFGSSLVLNGGEAGVSASGGIFGAGGSGGYVSTGSGFSGAGGGAGSQQTSTSGGNGGGYLSTASGGSTDGGNGSDIVFSTSGGSGGSSLSDGGGGGSSLFGIGGNGGHGSGGVGNSGSGYGAAGGGGAGGVLSVPGGSGTNGFLIVEWWY
jgi:hypothetical protein